MKNHFRWALAMALTLCSLMARSQSNGTLYLVNADSNGDITQLSASAVLYLGDLPPNLNIRAVPNPSLNATGVGFSSSDGHSRTENAAPYAYRGDSGGNYYAWTPSTGTLIITVTYLNGNSPIVSDTYQIEFNQGNEVPGTVPVTGVSLDQSALALDKGQSAELGHTVYPADATDQAVSWATSNGAVATVGSTGMVTAVAEGTATITVTTLDGGHTATATVTVSNGQDPPPPTGDATWSISGSNVYYNNGNVGIGTSSPSTRLHVSGGSGALISSTDALLRIKGTGTGNYQGATLKLEAHGTNDGLNHGATWMMHHRGTDGKSSFELQRRNLAGNYKGSIMSYRDEVGWRFYTAETTTSDMGIGMGITGNGKVGIGTFDPKSLLDVHGQISSSYDGSRRLMMDADGDGNAYFNYTGASDGARLGFQVNGSSFMSISTNGSVGIGTSTITEEWKLAVNGKIRAKEIKVETGWADYVFKKGYRLPTLKEVEEHIRKKGRLINIPSEKEVRENGIELGEMNKLLLEKIEELTLYILDQEKRIKELENDQN